MNIIRDVTIQAQKELDRDEIALFIGARQAGKTTILHQLESYLKGKNESVFFLNLEDPEYLSLLNESPKNLFKIITLDLTHKNFVFIDEIQYLNNPTNFLKYYSDQYRDQIKLLVSGSSAFYLDRKFKDSLVGRKKIYNVRTLSFHEFLRFKNESLLAQEDWSNLALQEKEKILFYFREYLLYGGYPKVVLSPIEEKSEILREILFSYVKKDIYEANIRQDEIFFKLLKILSGQVGSLVNANELASTLGVSKTAIDNYLYVAQKSFHLALIKPFAKNVRKELTKMPKVYFYDLGLRNYLSGSFVVYELRGDKGLVLENAVFCQLLEKHEVEEIRFWRTTQGQEVDFVVGQSAYEVKVNLRQFKKVNYKTFLSHYRDLDFFLVSLEVKEKTADIKLLEAWQI